jgi:hypothetical protein
MTGDGGAPTARTPFVRPPRLHAGQPFRRLA